MSTDSAIATLAPFLLRWRRGSYVMRPPPKETRYAVLAAPGSERRVFAKVYKQNARNEFDRGAALFEGGAQSGLFRAPRPLMFIEEQQLVLWEYESALQESRDYLVESVKANAPAAQRASLFRSAGRAMAGTHDALGKLPSRGEYRPIRSVRSPSSSVRARVEEALASTPLVMLHWDYACGNLFVRDDAVWVLDPMPNFYMMPEYFAVEGFTSDLRGSPYVDAAQFVFSFRAHPRFSGWMSEEKDPCLDAFLEGYGEVAGRPLEPCVVLACAAEMTLMYRDFIDRTSPARSPTDRLDRALRTWTAEQLFAEAAARLAP